MCISRTGKRRICPDCLVGVQPCQTTPKSTLCSNPNLSLQDRPNVTLLQQVAIRAATTATTTTTTATQDIGESQISVVNTESITLKASPNRYAVCRSISSSRKELEGRVRLNNKKPLQEVVNVALACRAASWKSDLTLDSEGDEADSDNDEFHRVQLHLQYNDRNLTKLHLDHLNIGDAGVTQLGNALLFNHVVTELRLENNGITAKGMLALCKCLQQNKELCIERLSLSSNPIGSDGVVSISRYIQCLPRRGSLKSLWLMSTGMGDTGMSALARALRCNPVEELYFQNNHIGSRGAMELAVLLSKDKVLRVLNLHKNCIGDYGVVTLIKEGLFQNDASCLEQFILSANDIGNDAGVAMGAYLGWNPKLQILDLSMNRIGDAGLTMIAMGMTQNFRLTYLNIGENVITDDGVTALAKCLQVNSKLSTLCLNGNGNITEIGVRALARSLVTNSALIVIAGLAEMGVGADLLQAVHILLERNTDSE